jgi:segregation and condensation protein B
LSVVPSLKQITEAILFAGQSPVSISQIIEVLISVQPSIHALEQEILQIIDELNEDYEEQDRSFRIERLGNAYTFKTSPETHKWLKHIQHENLNRKLTQSAVETLAIIAYKQPVTKPMIDSIRGVDSGHMVRQLMEKGLIDVSGRADTAGRPLLYKTSPVFLNHFGLQDLSELPKPREIDEIIRDDDMAEHRQLMMELKADLTRKQ